MSRYIDADALIDAINGCDYNYCDCGQWHTITQNAKDMIAKTIKNQPIADAVEVVHGEWLKKHDEYWNVYWYECSVCGRKPPNDTFGQEWQSNYCPNCGAEMRSK